MFRFFVATILFSAALPAALLRQEVAEQRDVLAGMSFGSAGAYEYLRGRVSFAVDPAATRVVDIQFAPRNAAGQVEFSADFVLLRPKDPAKGNRTLLVEPPNRGGMGLLSMYNRATGSPAPSAPEHFGDGYLLREGYTLAWIGWQHDVPNRPGLLRADVPKAPGITGVVRGEHTPSTPVDRLPLGDSGHIPYRVVKMLSLTVRDGIHGHRRPIPVSEWRLDGDSIALASPATPGRTYEFLYESVDPAVAGLGLVAIRDFASAAKYGPDSRVKYVLGAGTSQSAMALRALVYEGFNADEKGRRVFDGLLPHVAGGRRSTFERFTQPSRTSGPLRNASLSTTDQFPYSDADDTEPATGRRDSILARARAAKVVPKILYTNSTYEYFGSAGGLVHTSLDGKRDLPLPDTTRVYLLAGGQHGPAAFPPKPGPGENLPNWNDYRWAHRALLRSLRAWVAEDVPPPPSRYPRLADGTLHRDPRAHRTQYLDFGPDYLTKGIAANQPPKPGPDYSVFVPKTGSDGNDMSGIKMPWVSVALGAFTGWNLRSARIGAAGELLGQTGSYIPFSEPQVHLLYPSDAEYRKRLAAAAELLVNDRFILREDVPAILAFGQAAWDWSQRDNSTRAATAPGLK